MRTRLCSGLTLPSRLSTLERREVLPQVSSLWGNCGLDQRSAEPGGTRAWGVEAGNWEGVLFEEAASQAPEKPQCDSSDLSHAGPTGSSSGDTPKGALGFSWCQGCPVYFTRQPTRFKPTFLSVPEAAVPPQWLRKATDHIKTARTQEQFPPPQTMLDPLSGR